ncbi:MAG: hypothetical protein ABEJ83_02780 [Candidatus Nanohaloarchaea archaeon]
MAERWSKERTVKNNYAFHILKIIATREKESYAKEINEILEKNDREEVSRVISKLQDIGLVKKGERTRAQYYELRRKGLTELFCEIWNIESQPPEKIDEFLEKYLKEYENTEGTIETLLRRDFANALQDFLEHTEKENYEELISFFQEIEGIDEYEPPSKAFERALNST